MLYNCFILTCLKRFSNHKKETHSRKFVLSKNHQLSNLRKFVFPKQTKNNLKICHNQYPRKLEIFKKFFLKYAFHAGQNCNCNSKKIRICCHKMKFRRASARDRQVFFIALHFQGCAETQLC